MIYKGFVIKPVYHLLADCQTNKDGDFLHHPNGQIRTRKPSKADIDHYEILDPVEGGRRWIAEDTVDEAKATIDRFLNDSNMKDNTVSSWEKLDGYNPAQLNVVDIHELNRS